MATEFRAACPNCKVKVTVSDSGNEVAYVKCEACGKEFGLRLPQNRPPSKQPEPAPVHSQLPDFGSSLPTEPMDWSSYAAPKKPLIALKPLAISLGVVAALGLAIGIGSLILRQAERLDLGAVGDAIMNGPADSSETIFQDWKRYAAEQKRLLESIKRKTDCPPLIIPMERLEEKYLNLLVRGALIENTKPPAFQTTDLPAAPAVTPDSGRSFRTVEPFLTTEFREAEEKVNVNSNAVLSYLHVEATPLPPPADEFEKQALTKISTKRALCRLLADAHRGGDETLVANSILELAESLKLFRTAATAGGPKAGVLPAAVQYADHTADKMRFALAARFTRQADSQIAKALAALEQTF